MLLGCTQVAGIFEPQKALELIEKEKITATVMTPTMLIMIFDKADYRKYDLSSLRQLQYGASPMPLPTLKKAMEVFKNSEFLQIYGTTEGNLNTANLIQEEHVVKGPEKVLKRLPSIGREAYNVQMAILDEEGNEVPQGEVGEVVSRSSFVMDGYWKEPELTAEAFKYGWLHVGDMGYQDEDGYIYLVDRKKDMIITGGFNVYSKEVEDAIYKHPAVDEVAVIGVPDKTWGEAIKAIVRLKTGMEATGEEIIQTSRNYIASYKVPKSIDFVDDFPRTALMKIQKNILREKYWKGYDKRIHGGAD